MSTKILGQDIQTQKYTTGGGTTAYTATVPNLTALYDWFAITVKMNATNTGSSTLNVNGLWAKTIKKPGVTNLAASDLLINSVYTLVYDLAQDFFFISNIETANNIGDYDIQNTVFWYKDGTLSVVGATAASNLDFSGATDWFTALNIGNYSFTWDGYIYNRISGKPNTANQYLRWDDIDTIELEFTAEFDNPTATRYLEVWLADSSATTWWTDFASLQRRILLSVWNGTTASALIRTADWTTASSSTAITVTTTNWNTYKIVFDKAGLSVMTYVNGVLGNTKATDLPAWTNNVVVGIGLESPWGIAHELWITWITVRVKYA
jgi:hypothetical protein